MIDTLDDLRLKSPTLRAGWLPDAPHPGLQALRRIHEAAVAGFEATVTAHAGLLAGQDAAVASYRRELRVAIRAGHTPPDPPDAVVADAHRAVAQENVVQAGVDLAHVAEWAVRALKREERGLREVLEAAFAATTAGSREDRALNAEPWVGRLRAIVRTVDVPQNETGIIVRFRNVLLALAPDGFAPAVSAEVARALDAVRLPHRPAPSVPLPPPSGRRFDEAVPMDEEYREHLTHGSPGLAA